MSALEVDTAHGTARLLIDSPRGSRRPSALLALGHGAGGGPDAVDLAALADRLPAHGIEVVRVEQPWRLAGKRIAPRPAVLDEAWTQALASAPRLSGSGRRAAVPLIVGGRSAGARVACRTAGALGAAGCLALAFPLHPPGKGDDPERDRSGELVDAGVPALILQGERDAFGGPNRVSERVAAAAAGGSAGGRAEIRVIPVPQAGHELTVPKKATVTQSEVLELIAGAAAEWIEGLINGK